MRLPRFFKKRSALKRKSPAKKLIAGLLFIPICFMLALTAYSFCLELESSPNTHLTGLLMGISQMIGLHRFQLRIGRGQFHLPIQQVLLDCLQCI